ncbi:hypothetical protein DDZ13_05550 [Coraliomargarita sinensis]|uniref:Recombinase family protein n=2 Tax=Coraliomargarita sinensis TaxID=2174842 RepID=A0A317ZL14_9BACT|nr:hypothetical protein DDZ13_05550 [Coraliomargarita sinensis]
MMRQAILYSRYSSAQQRRGDTIRRQLANGKEYAEKLGLELVEITDEGVSAYKKKNNTNSGNLGTLLAAAEEGKIPNGTILIVESLDRVSRQSPLDALDIFKRFLKAGMEIHTLMDGQVYTWETVQSNLMLLMGSIMYMSRAYDESRHKSKRIGESIKKRKEKVISGEGIWLGSKPHWIRTVDGEVCVDEDSAETVRYIFKLYLEGYGASRVCKKINAEGIKSARGRKWEYKVVQDLLKNPAVYGVLRISGDEIENYYPAVVSKEDFNRAQHERALRTPKKGRASVNHKNVFSGLLKCGKCGNSMYFTQVGSVSRNDKRYHAYKCGTKRSSQCENPSIKFDIFRSIFFNWFKDLDYTALNKSGEDTKLIGLRQKLESQRGALLEVKEKEANWMKAIEAGLDIKAATEKINALQSEKNDLEFVIKEFEQEIFALENVAPVEPIELDGYEDFDAEQNDRLNYVLKRQIDKITLTSEKITGKIYNRLIRVHWKNGQVSTVFIQRGVGDLEREVLSFEEVSGPVKISGLESLGQLPDLMTNVDFYTEDAHSGNLVPIQSRKVELTEKMLWAACEKAGVPQSEAKRFVKSVLKLFYAENSARVNYSSQG